MAVARITAPKEWHENAVRAVLSSDAGDPWDRRKLARELGRAATRYGLQAEIHDQEAEILVAALPEDERAAEALRAMRDCHKRESERPRARDIIMDRMNAVKTKDPS